MSTDTLPASERVLYENGQYLWEEDPQNPGEITQAAKDAQKAKWKRLMENRGPYKQLLRSKMSNGSNHPPLYRFGIPYTYDWMIAYAKRHDLKLELRPEQRKGREGMESLNMREIDLEDAPRHDRTTLKMLACYLSIQHIKERCEFAFETGRPFAMEYDGILSFWSNYDMRERAATQIGMAARYKRTVAELMEAMSEDGGNPPEPMWWFDWENDVGLFTSLE